MIDGHDEPLYASHPIDALAARNQQLVAQLQQLREQLAQRNESYHRLYETHQRLLEKTLRPVINAFDLSGSALDTPEAEQMEIELRPIHYRLRVPSETVYRRSYRQAYLHLHPARVSLGRNDMRTRDIIEGLQTLMPFYDRQDGSHNGAEHDVLYAYATDKPLTDKALCRMIELGWEQEHDERDYKKDFTQTDYRPDESWVCYT